MSLVYLISDLQYQNVRRIKAHNLMNKLCAF